MTAVDRWVGRLALAMLPAGAIMTVASALGLVAVAALAIDTLVRRPPGEAWLLGWCLVASAAAVRNTVKAIETMSSFEWRPLAQVLALSAAILVAWPGWWIAG